MRHTVFIRLLEQVEPRMGRHVLLVHELLEPACHLLGQVIELRLSQRRLELRSHLGRRSRFERATEPGGLRAAELNVPLVQVLRCLRGHLIRTLLEPLAHLLRHDLVRVVRIQRAPDGTHGLVRHLLDALAEAVAHHVFKLIKRHEPRAIFVDLGEEIEPGMHREVLLVERHLKPLAKLFCPPKHLVLSQRRLELRSHLGRRSRFERATEPSSLRAAELNGPLVQVGGRLGLEIGRAAPQEGAKLLRVDLVRIIGVDGAPEGNERIFAYRRQALFEAPAEHVLKLVVCERGRGGRRGDGGG